MDPKKFQNKSQYSSPSQVLGQRLYILGMYLHSDCRLWAYWWRRRQKKTPQFPPHQIQAHHQNLQKRVTGEVSVRLAAAYWATTTGGSECLREWQALAKRKAQGEGGGGNSLIRELNEG